MQEDQEDLAKEFRPIFYRNETRLDSNRQGSHGGDDTNPAPPAEPLTPGSDTGATRLSEMATRLPSACMRGHTRKIGTGQ